MNDAKAGILLFLVCLTLGGVTAIKGVRAEAQPVVNGKLGAQLDEYLSRLAAYGFSGSVLVAKGDEIALHKGYGLADPERGVANTTETVYDIASLAKQFTAAAILKLEMQGKLKTSDAISRHLDGVPPDKQTITLHHLLTHNSGLPFECAGAADFDREQFVKCMLAAKLNAEPGQQYNYSNGGYGLLAAIIERASGQSYEAFLTQQLFTPAGLSATGFGGDAEKWRDGDIARGSDAAIERPAVRPARMIWLWRGAANVITSTGDLFKWEQALRRNRILSFSAAKKLFTAYVATDQRGSSYGYGWAITKTSRGTRLIGHDGVTTTGFTAIHQRYVDEGVTIIAASNHFDSRFLPLDLAAPDLASIIFTGRAALPPAFTKLDPAELEKYRGSYRLSSGAQLIVTADQDKLIVGAEGQAAVDLLAAADAARGKWLAAGNERTARFINGVREQHYEPVVAAFAGQLTPEQARQTVRNWLGNLEQKHGPLKSFELLGTIPEAGLARTFVRLTFERGSEVRRFRWEGERLGNIVFGRLPLLATIFRPQSKAEFTGFHLGIGQPVRVSFSFDAAGAVKALTVHAPSGSVRAERVLKPASEIKTGDIH